MVKSFTAAGYVDDETQKNDLAIVKLVAEVNEVVPNNRAYDFSFARQAEAQLNKQGGTIAKVRFDIPSTTRYSLQTGYNGRELRNDFNCRHARAHAITGVVLSFSTACKGLTPDILL